MTAARVPTRIDSGELVESTPLAREANLTAPIRTKKPTCDHHDRKAIKMERLRPIERVLTALRSRGRRISAVGHRRWQVQCPCHLPDNNPSLSIRELPDGTVLLKCFALCNADQILSSLGLRPRDLFNRAKREHQLQLR
jgi:hypothetical protein